MTAGEAQDRRSWWQALEPALDLKSSSAEGPVPWPDPIDLHDGTPLPVTEGPDPDIPASRAIDPDPPVSGVDEDRAVDPADPVGAPGAMPPRPPVDDGGEGWSSALWADDQVEDPLGPVDSGEAPPLYARHEVLSSPKGWYGAFAGRSTNTLLVGALAVVGMALLGLLLVVRSGSDPTQSARARPGAQPVVTDDDPSAVTTTLSTFPTVVEPTTAPAAPPATSEPAAVAPAAVGPPATQSPVAESTPTATTPARSPSPSPSPPATTPETPATEPQSAPPQPEPTTLPAPPVTTTSSSAPVVVTTPPGPATSVPIPTFTIPSTSRPPNTRPTVPVNPRR